MSSEDANGHVDDANEPSKARTRVSRACVRCRSRKDKCDGQRPSCLTCINAGVPQSCSYTESKRRGLPEGYVRSLEKTFALLIKRFDIFEDGVVAVLRADKELLADGHEALHTAWKECDILRELESLLRSTEHGPRLGSKREHDETESRMNDSTEADATMEEDYKPTHVLSLLPSGDTKMSRALAPGIERKSVSAEPFKLPAGASESANDYFQHIHTWLPILDRPEVLKKCYELARRGVPVSTRDPALAKLSAALALASIHVQLIPQAQKAIDATFLYDTAKHCVPFMDGLYETGHVHAIALLALADIASSRWSQAWINVGLAARIIVDLLQSVRAKERQETSGLQAVFILDTLVAIRLARKPQLRRNDLGPLMIEDGHEEWEPLPGNPGPGFVISTFNRLTEVFASLNEYLHSEDVDFGLQQLVILSQSYPFAVAGTSALSPHQQALKVSHYAALAYIGFQSQEHISRSSQNLTLATECSSMSTGPVTSLISTALLEIVRQQAPNVDTLGASNKRARTSKHQSEELNLWPADPFTQALLPQSHQYHEISTGDQMEYSRPMQQVKTGIDGPGFELGGLHHRESAVGTYGPSIATSPSFQGDEIDALFREMAQLDTTEWASGRNQMVKDFGFADQLAFEAFCNDPDRVFTGPNGASDTSSMPTYSAATFTASSQPNVNLDAFDITSSTWHG